MILKYIKSGFQKIKEALKKSRSFLVLRLESLFGGFIDVSKVDALEELLYEADLGLPIAERLTQKVREALALKPRLSQAELIVLLKKELLSTLPLQKEEVEATPTKLKAIFLVGVNGNGKTTTAAKLAFRFLGDHKRVIFGAADTFRAAAQEQLTLWAERLSIPIIKGKSKGDPAAVVFETIEAALSQKADIALIDTAGRLHTKTPLMQELEKMERSAKKACPGIPCEVFLILDATVGQDALEQARIFSSFTGITGLILTKIDGTAKGGIAIAIADTLKIPIRYLGVGEEASDLERFDPVTFIDSLFQE